jgi:hypothetical protein
MANSHLQTRPSLDRAGSSTTPDRSLEGGEFLTANAERDALAVVSPKREIVIVSKMP